LQLLHLLPQCCNDGSQPFIRGLSSHKCSRQLLLLLLLLLWVPSLAVSTCRRECTKAKCQNGCWSWLEGVELQFEQSRQSPLSKQIAEIVTLELFGTNTC
jgi:hypothetical protein